MRWEEHVKQIPFALVTNLLEPGETEHPHTPQGI